MRCEDMQPLVVLHTVVRVYRILLDFLQAQNYPIVHESD